MREVNIKPRHPVGASFKLYKTVRPKVREGRQSVLDDVIVGYQLTPKCDNSTLCKLLQTPRESRSDSLLFSGLKSALVMINNQNKMQLCQHYPHKSINYCHTLLLIRILSTAWPVFCHLSSPPLSLLQAPPSRWVQCIHKGIPQSPASVTSHTSCGSHHLPQEEG